MASTTRDLFDGTTKDTYQVWGPSHRCMTHDTAKGLRAPELILPLGSGRDTRIAGFSTEELQGKASTLKPKQQTSPSIHHHTGLDSRACVCSPKVRHQQRTPEYPDFLQPSLLAFGPFCATWTVRQIPGYCGFIPASAVNEQARRQADLQEPRPRALDLRLSYRHNTPGYTGHEPSAARNDVGPMRCGSSSLTTSGAAARGLIL